MKRKILVCGLALGAAAMFGCNKEEPAHPVVTPPVHTPVVTPTTPATPTPPATAIPSAATPAPDMSMPMTEPAAGGATSDDTAKVSDPDSMLTSFSDAVQAKDYDKAGEILKTLLAHKSEFSADIQSKIEAAESTLSVAKKASSSGLGDLTAPQLPSVPEEPSK